ncbi:hypothetical protein BC829DRAFT_384594 [Chytridium lagenaria]|nr:hypothetical protein BC829DRAFT_384594 [Chytridium lagenaria]
MAIDYAIPPVIPEVARAAELAWLQDVVDTADGAVDNGGEEQRGGYAGECWMFGKYRLQGEENDDVRDELFRAAMKDDLDQWIDDIPSSPEQKPALTKITPNIKVIRKTRYALPIRFSGNSNRLVNRVIKLTKFAVDAECQLRALKESLLERIENNSLDSDHIKEALARSENTLSQRLDSVERDMSLLSGSSHTPLNQTLQSIDETLEILWTDRNQHNLRLYAIEEGDLDERLKIVEKAGLEGRLRRVETITQRVSTVLFDISDGDLIVDDDKVPSGQMEGKFSSLMKQLASKPFDMEKKDAPTSSTISGYQPLLTKKVVIPPSVIPPSASMSSNSPPEVKMPQQKSLPFNITNLVQERAPFNVIPNDNNPSGIKFTTLQEASTLFSHITPSTSSFTNPKTPVNTTTFASFANSQPPMVFKATTSPSVEPVMSAAQPTSSPLACSSPQPSLAFNFSSSSTLPPQPSTSKSFKSFPIFDFSSSSSKLPPEPTSSASSKPIPTFTFGSNSSTSTSFSFSGAGGQAPAGGSGGFKFGQVP